MLKGVIMPAKIVFDKERVVNAALKIAENNGLEALNARSLAKEIGCSTQPIYLRYPDMSAVKAETVAAARRIYGQYLEFGLKSKPSLFEGYLSAYIRFARERPKLFAMLFMRDTGEEKDDGLKDIIVDKISALGDYDKKTSEKFFFSAWFFAHGIASQLASGFIRWSERDTDAFLKEQFGALKLYYKNDGKKE